MSATAMLETNYRQTRTRVCELMRTLSEEQLATPVPATPRWTVHELLAHLVGGAADAADRRLDGVTGDDWTARHVEERRRQSVRELVADWDRVGPTAEAGLLDNQRFGPNLAADAICHEADLREALGCARVDREHWQPFLDVMMLFLRKQLRQHPVLVIRDEQGHQWSCGSGDPTTHLQADGYELWRATFSRRSQRQIAAWDWSPEPVEPIIQRFGFFGPRHDDQPIPAAST